MLELHHYEPYANSKKCLICLEEKGLAFTSRYVDILRFEQHEAAFVKIKPNGQVPVLVHDGKTIVESSIINEYLDDVFSEISLRPSDLVARARMRVWSKRVDEILMQSVSMIGWQVRFRPLAQSIDRAEFAERMKRVPLKEIREKWEITAGPGFSEAQLEESRINARPAVKAAFGYSRFKNAPGRAQDADKVLRA